MSTSRPTSVRDKELGSLELTVPPERQGVHLDILLGLAPPVSSGPVAQVEQHGRRHAHAADCISATPGKHHKRNSDAMHSATHYPSVKNMQSVQGFLQLLNVPTASGDDIGGAGSSCGDDSNHATEGEGVSAATANSVFSAFAVACSEFGLRRSLALMAHYSITHRGGGSTVNSDQFFKNCSVTGSDPSDLPLSDITSTDDAAHIVQLELKGLNATELLEHCTELHLILIKLFEVSRAQKADMMIAMRSMASLGPAAGTVVHTTDRVKKQVDEDGSKSINGYVVLDELGRGSCGKVKLAFDSKHNRMVAIKIVRRADTAAKVGGASHAQQVFEALLREIAVMKKLRHKNIVSLYEVIDDPDAEKLYLVMQYVDNGPMTTTNERDCTCNTIVPLQLLKYACNIFAGLMYLHSHNVIHRDIKPENILVSKQKVAYLADFGVSDTFGLQKHQHLKARMPLSPQEGGGAVKGRKGTVLFMAPELLQHGHADNGVAVDMWACGVTLYAALTGKLPFASEVDILDAKRFDFAHIDIEYGKDWDRLLRGLLAWRPEDRMTAMEAHKMVKGMLRVVELTERRNRARERAESIHVGEHDISSALTALAKVDRDNPMLAEGHFHYNTLYDEATDSDTGSDTVYDSINDSGELRAWKPTPPRSSATSPFTSGEIGGGFKPFHRQSAVDRSSEFAKN